jgi:Zn-dependent peptidase ImmA (M78 family)
MAKNIVNRVDRNLARRLREARRETGLSVRAVAAGLPAKLAVSHVTIGGYERGVTKPTIHVLAALADLYGRTLNWFLDQREGLSDFRYRNLKSRVPVGDQRQFEAQAAKWIDAYIRLEKHLCPKRRPDRAKQLDSGHDLRPEFLAAAVRRSLNLEDSQPIDNTVSVLESFSALAMELRTTFGIDGAAAKHGNDFVVVLNPEANNDRLRMNAAYELAHLLYDEHKQDLGWSNTAIEQRAYEFASLLLIPESQLTRAFDGKSFLRLVEYKERFGVSLANMIYRGEKSGVINSTAARAMIAEMTRQGGSKAEPGFIWRDRAISFEKMLESAIQTKTLTWIEAEQITGVREGELRQRLADAISQTRTASQSGGTDNAKQITVPFTLR